MNVEDHLRGIQEVAWCAIGKRGAAGALTSQIEDWRFPVDDRLRDEQQRCGLGVPKNHVKS